MSGKRGGKFSKPARGGGKKFSRNLKPLEDDVDEKPGMWDMDEPKDTAAGSDEGSGDEAENSAMTREERKALQKARKEAAKAKAAATKTTDSGDDDDDEDEEKDDGQPPLVNPNLTPGNPNAPGRVGVGGMSRREREAKEAAAAKERYMKLHAQGKTDEAKADLARLAVIRKEREEKAKQRQAELDEKKRLAEEKATVQGRKK